MTTPAAAAAQHPAAPARSVFTGTDVARAAGFTVTAGGRGPVFDEDVWDFSAVAHLPAWLPPSTRRWDFTVITNPGFRLAAKELLVALLAPRHEAVAVLPGAYRVPRAIATCRDRLTQLASWLNWLANQKITSLAHVTQQHCDAYLEHRRYQRDEGGKPVRELSCTARQAAVIAVLDLHCYTGLLAGGGYQPGFRPWNGKSAAAVTGAVPRRQNTTPPVTDEVLRPMLAAALHFTEVTGPLVAGLAERVRAAARVALAQPDRPLSPVAVIGRVLAEHRAAGDPLPLTAGHLVKQRLLGGWDPVDPLLHISFGQLARRAGLAQFHSAWLPGLRPALEDTLAQVGAAKPWGRDAARIPLAAGDGTVPWTLPMHGYEVTDLAEITRTAFMVVIAAITGMRKSELAELTTASPQPPRQIAPGLARYRLAGRVIKHQPHGGTPDEWTVIAEVHRAATLAASLPPPPGAGDPGGADGPGGPLFGRFSFGGDGAHLKLPRPAH
jgi:hypothetical protein